MTRTPDSPPPQERRPVRTLGDVIDALPYRKLGNNPLLKLDPLPNDVLPALNLPGFVDEVPPEAV